MAEPIQDAKAAPLYRKYPETEGFGLSVPALNSPLPGWVYKAA
jgi:hypothetical protein